LFHVWLFHLIVVFGLGMSGVTGMGLRESSHINRSLSALADVLTALAEHRGHVPYRNSRLTYLLQDSIGMSTCANIVVHTVVLLQHIILGLLGFPASLIELKKIWLADTCINRIPSPASL
jgi:hypothetical protein